MTDSIADTERSYSLDDLRSLASRASRDSVGTSLPLFVFAVLTALLTAGTLFVPLPFYVHSFGAWLLLAPLGFAIIWAMDARRRRSVGLKARGGVYGRAFGLGIASLLPGFFVFAVGPLVPIVCTAAILQSSAARQRDDRLRTSAITFLLVGALAAVGMIAFQQTLARQVAAWSLPVCLLIAGMRARHPADKTQIFSDAELAPSSEGGDAKTFDLGSLNTLAAKVRRQSTRVSVPLLTFGALLLIPASIGAATTEDVFGFATATATVAVAVFGFMGLWLLEIRRDQTAGVRAKRAGYGLAAILALLIGPVAFIPFFLAPGSSTALVGLLLIIPAMRVRSGLLWIAAIGSVVIAVLSWVTTTSLLYVNFLTAGLPFVDFTVLGPFILAGVYLLLGATALFLEERR